MASFTDRTVANLKPDPNRRLERFDDVVPGLAIRVNFGGAKSWVLFYRAGHRQRRLTLGRYPILRLAEARKKSRKLLNRLAAEGKDPAEERRAARAPGDTFGDLATDYLKHAKHKRSLAEDERILRTELLPHWRSRKVREIARRDVRALIEAIADRPAPVMANRVWALTSRLFNYAIEKDWIDASPASRIGKQPETSRDRVLTDDELRELWNTLDDAREMRRVADDADQSGLPAKARRLAPMIARGLQMLLVTAQRPGEVFRMRWSGVDLETAWWTIPAAHSKNGEPHRVPLTSRAMELLQNAQAVAPPDNQWVFAGIAGASVAARSKKAAALLRSSEAITFDFHRHDLRRTAASGMAAAGVPRDTIARVLNHVDRGSRATAVYDRYSYDTEKRQALETWERRLTAIVGGATKSDRVVDFHRRVIGV